MEIDVPSVADAREVLRCDRCRLVQFRAISNICRRCDNPFPVPPQLEPDYIASASPRSMHSIRYKSIRKLSIGHKLKMVREFNNITQMDLAAKTKMPRTYISRIENSRLLPGPKILQRLADELEISILDLLPNLEEKNNMELPDTLYWNALFRSVLHLQADQIAQIMSQVRAMIDSNSNNSELIYLQKSADIAPSPVMDLINS